MVERLVGGLVEFCWSLGWWECVVGGYAFMSGDVKEEGLERFKGMNLTEKELAVNRKLAFRTALAR